MLIVLPQLRVLPARADRQASLRTLDRLGFIGKRYELLTEVPHRDHGRRAHRRS